MKNKSAAAAPQVSVDVTVTKTQARPAVKTEKRSGAVVYCGPSQKGRRSSKNLPSSTRRLSR